MVNNLADTRREGGGGVGVVVVVVACICLRSVALRLFDLRSFFSIFRPSVRLNWCTYLASPVIQHPLECLFHLVRRLCAGGAPCRG